jgi:EpsI family protein
MSKSRVTRNACFLAACSILALQAIGLRSLSIDEHAVPIPGLGQIPLTLGPWTTTSAQTLEPEVVAALRPDDYILRDYAAAGMPAPVSLFVAYFKSLQNDYGPHSPRICLPGAGWLITGSKTILLAMPGRQEKIPVNQYLMRKSDERILVLYWYQNSRHIWAEEFNAKLTMLPDLIRYRRSDASLVRLIVRMQGTSPDAELASAEQFAQLVFPHLVDLLAVGNPAAANR